MSANKNALPPVLLVESSPPPPVVPLFPASQHGRMINGKFAAKAAKAANASNTKKGGSRKHKSNRKSHRKSHRCRTHKK